MIGRLVTPERGYARQPREPRTLPEIMAAYERVVIIKALQLNGGSVTRTASSLGIRRERLYSRVRVLGIDLREVLEVLKRERR